LQVAAQRPAGLTPFASSVAQPTTKRYSTWLLSIWPHACSISCIAGISASDPLSARRGKRAGAQARRR
jgi:hypothetical protein